MRITDIQYGKYYIKPEWEGTGMCITVGDDFNIMLGILKKGIFSKLQSNFLDIKLTDDLIEIE
jgi:hypothetical protein